MSDDSRFAFGENWSAFLRQLDEARIETATASVSQLIGSRSLAGKSCLDIGSGSGLFSLAAARLGAARIVSLDFDPDCVRCTGELRTRLGQDANWSVLQGSVLDDSFMVELGQFDLVYSWGVLHHTGDLRKAIKSAAAAVRPGGQLVIALYNDQGGASRRWLRIKQVYHRLPGPLRPAWVVAVAGAYELKFAAARILRLQNPLPFRDWRSKRADRGMSAWHDWVDWIGGLPFEVAKPEQVIVPLRHSGFTLENLTTVGSGWGCNQFVFSRDQGPVKSR